MYTRTTTTARRTPVRPASAASIRYARSLWTERVNDVDPATMQAAEHDQRAVSAIIDTLRNAPRKPSSVPAPAGPTEPGYYRAADGTLAKVQRSKSTGNLYALALVQRGGPNTRGTFDYVAGLVRRLPATPLTKDEAAALGRGLGCCVRCGAELSDDERKGRDGLTSVQRGMGPDCAKAW